MDVLEVVEILDFGHGVGCAVAEDEVGGSGGGGDEFAMGGNVEDVWVLAIGNELSFKIFDKLIVGDRKLSVGGFVFV